MFHLWQNHLLFSVYSHTLPLLFIHPRLLFISVPGRWIQFGKACGQTFVCPSSLNCCLLAIRFVGDGSEGKGRKKKTLTGCQSITVQFSSRCLRRNEPARVATDVAITCYWKGVKAPGNPTWNLLVTSFM